MAKLDIQTRLRQLRAALIEGEQSGPAQPFDLRQFLEERRKPKQDRDGRMDAPSQLK